MKIKKARYSFIILMISLVGVTGCEKINKSYENSNANNIQLSGEDELDASQSYFEANIHPIAKAEDGYYYVDSLLNYYDNSTQSSIPLCSKANCDHKGKDCMARLDSKGIYYYEGYLYHVSIIDGTAVLERMDKDGNNRKSIAELCNTSGNVPGIVFCDGYVYYNPELMLPISDEKQTISIQRVSVNGGAPEKIYECTGINPTFTGLKSYGHQVYVIMREYIKTDDKNGSLMGKSLISIDGETKENKIVMEGNLHSFCIDSKSGQLYYFITSDGLYRYDISSKTTKQLMHATEQSGMCTLSFDGKYVYMDNLRWETQIETFLKLDTNIVGEIWIYDQEDNLKKEINVEELKCDTIFYGDSSRLFINASSVNGEKGMFYMDKKNLDNETWTKLK